MILCISMQWFREWEGFVKGKDNGIILQIKLNSCMEVHYYPLLSIKHVYLCFRATWSH